MPKDKERKIGPRTPAASGRNGGDAKRDSLLTMIPEEALMSDGRYITFYWFEEPKRD